MFRLQLHHYVQKIMHLEEQLKPMDKFNSKTTNNNFSYQYNEDHEFETDEQMTQFYNSIKVLNDKIKHNF